MNELNLFFRELKSTIVAQAGSKSAFFRATFTEYMCNYLEEIGYINNYESFFYKKESKGIAIDGWDYNTTKREITLFITNYSTEIDPERVSQSDATLYFKRVLRFFSASIEDQFFMKMDESSDGYTVAREIWNSSGEIESLKIILLTNNILSDRFDSNNINIDSNLSCQIHYDVWDLKRLYRIENSKKEKEDIIIKFTDYDISGLPCLEASGDAQNCKSYLLALPGNILADLYRKYGERLLEQNVRTFLQFRAKVNKGIRNTIKNEPEMFFAYNNGLTVTADNVIVENGHLKEISNLQIVNGGQTTASLYVSYLNNKKEIDLSKIYIQVKLTSISDKEQIDSIVPKISEYANTQNKVSASDFFSNHPFHKRIEDFSRRILAPSADGSHFETYWFYERARGQYANKQTDLTPAEKKQFLKQYPKKQKFTKTDLAKYIHTFEMKPHFVSKGAQWNFGKFADLICGKSDSKEGLWAKDDRVFNEKYYRDLIAKAILFKELDKHVFAQNWYTGYKANIVTYTIAKFRHLILKNGYDFNYEKVWAEQRVSYVLMNELLRLAEQVAYQITATKDNVTQFCKKDICWTKVEQFIFILENHIYHELTPTSIQRDKKKEAIKNQEILSGVELQMLVMQKGSNYWKNVIKWERKNDILDDYKRDLLQIALRFNTNFVPSEKQSRKLLEIEKLLQDEGMLIQENEI